MTADDTGGGMHPSTNSLKSQTKLSNPTPTVIAQPLSIENDITVLWMVHKNIENYYGTSMPVFFIVN